MNAIAAAIFATAVREARLATRSVAFGATVLLGGILITAGHGLDLLAFDDTGERTWAIGIATASAFGSGWSVMGLGSTASERDGASENDGKRMLDASLLGIRGGWISDLLGRWLSAIAVCGLCLLYTLVLLHYTRAWGPGLIPAASALVAVSLAVAVPCAWARVLGVWLRGSTASLVAAALWVAGQVALARPWASWLPGPPGAASASPLEAARILVLVLALVTGAFAGLERRRA